MVDRPPPNGQAGERLRPAAADPPAPPVPPATTPTPATPPSTADASRQPGQIVLPPSAAPDVPATTATVAAGHQHRSFAQLHRDVWRVVARSPLVFVLVPAVAWFLLDWLIESMVAGAGGSEWEQLRNYNRFYKYADLLVRIPVSVLFFAAIRLIASGEGVSFKRVWQVDHGLAGRLITTYFAAGWRIGLATLLLIVPGIYLTIRYLLAAPVAAFEHCQGTDALQLSGDYVKGTYWRIVRYACGSFFLYLPLSMAVLLILPEDASPLLLAVADIPINVLVMLGLVATTLLYADCRPDLQLHEPIGQPAPAPPATGRRGVLVAGVASVGILLGTFVFLVIMTPLPVETGSDVELGDAAYEAGDYLTALQHYQTAASDAPNVAYVQYSIGWCWVMLDDPGKAEPRMAAAVELEPENLNYLTGHCQVLMILGRTGEAELRLSQARAHGHAEEERLLELERQLQLQRQGQPEP